jgi:hypothetical protein
MAQPVWRAVRSLAVCLGTDLDADIGAFGHGAHDQSDGRDVHSGCCGRRRRRHCRHGTRAGCCAGTCPPGGCFRSTGCTCQEAADGALDDASFGQMPSTPAGEPPCSRIGSGLRTAVQWCGRTSAVHGYRTRPPRRATLSGRARRARAAECVPAGAVAAGLAETLLAGCRIGQARRGSAQSHARYRFRRIAAALRSLDAIWQLVHGPCPQ